ncbi:hypothetical protein HaLaN_17777 [Haematococcus lacustris]|uniref:Uncharacterized protein n=1 Tax=Haematococcus lacustris TaxID=44745 RepID=A0A699ZNX0_HAELA|nr:hypothetical protein HaLaN_17777 [Haematococcus lacustris]
MPAQMVLLRSGGPHALQRRLISQAAQCNIQLLWIAGEQQFPSVDSYTMSFVPERKICWPGDGDPNLLNYCTPRCPSGMRETGIIILTCQRGYIGVTILTCVRPDPSTVMQGFYIRRYDASCPVSETSTSRPQHQPAAANTTHLACLIPVDLIP